MSAISLYPKSWAKYQQGELDIRTRHSVLLLNSEYAFSSTHQSRSDIPTTSIVAEIALDGAQVQTGIDTVVVPDEIARFANIEQDQTITNLVVLVQESAEAESYLLYHSTDVTGLPMETGEKNISVSFPSGLLVVGTAGYSVPSIVVVSIATATPFDAVINNDIDKVLMNTQEFGREIVYYHSNSEAKTYRVMKTATPQDIPMADIDVNTVTQTIKAQRSVFYTLPKRGDKVILEGVTHIVAGTWLENYTIDIYLQETIAG